MKVRYKFNEISTKLMHVHITRTDEWIQARLGSGNNFRISEPMECDLEFFRDEKSVHLKGDIYANLILVCVKCLDEYDYYIRKNFLCVLFNSPKFSTQIKEEELTEETINEEFLEDGILDLENIVLQELLLTVPDYPRCNENCKGLCQECGTNLNYQKCNCLNSKDIEESNGLNTELER